MKQINIVELLKDCPKGMELDCAIYENVELDYIKQDPESKYPIHCLIKINGGYNPLVLTHNGCYDRHPNAKCIIFPKGKTTWDGFVPPCKFKDGDIIFDGYSDAICIFKGEGRIKGTVDFYCGVGISNELFIKDVKDRDEHFGYIDEYNLATEKEKQKLFNAIQDNGYKWNEETKTLKKLIKPRFKVGDRIKWKGHDASGRIEKIEDDVYHVDYGYDDGIIRVNLNMQDDYELVPDKFDIATLKPFDKVLMRSSNAREWDATFYSHYSNNKFYGCGMCCNQCIPYKDNEHLLGTDNDCDEYYKTWE